MDKNLEENMPIYVQIMNKIRGSVASGELEPGQRIPSVRELASDFGVNPNTMQRALTELEREGLLISERTAGRFVTQDERFISELRREAAIAAAESFRKEMEALGFTQKEAVDFFRKRCEEVGRKENVKVG